MCMKHFASFVKLAKCFYQVVSDIHDIKITILKTTVDA
jgi:hypothetical protein